MTTENNQSNEDQAKPETTEAEARKAKIEALRKEGIKFVADHTNELTEATNESIDKLIKVLQNNRGHIAGMVFVAIPAEGTQLVDHEDEGVWAIQMSTSGTAMTDCMLKGAVEEIVKGMGFERFHRGDDFARRRGAPEGLKGLMGLLDHLEGKKSSREK